MTVTINGTTGYSGPVGTIGDLTTTGNTTLGDASGDTLTINGSTTTLTQGTANGVAYLNGSKVLTTGSALVFDGSNLGIGTSSPDSKLHVVSGASSTLAQLRIGYNGTSVNYYDANTHYFRDGSGPTTRMTIDSSGNLGLGVTPSAWSSIFKSYQVGSGIGTAFLAGRSDAGAAQNQLGANAYFDGSWRYVGTGVASRYEQSSGVHSWHYAASGTAGNAITFTQAMTLDASGQLMVGKTSNSYGDASTKTFEISGSSSSIVALQYGGANGYYLQVNSTAGYLWNSANTPIVFGTNNTERARIDSSGNFGLGTTSPSNYAGYGTLTLNGSSGGEVDFKAGNTLYADIYAATSGMYIRALQSTPMMFWAGGSERMRLTSSGDLLINTTSNGFSASVLIYANSAVRNAVVSVDTGTTYGSNYYYHWFVNSSGNSAGSISHTAATTIAFLTSSDRRLKTNIVDAPSALEKISQAKVRSFDWKEDGVHVDYGFIAQELYEVIPEVVGKGDDFETVEDPKGTWQVEYGRLTPVLLKAIQELKAEFDAYKLTHP